MRPHLIGSAMLAVVALGALGCGGSAPSVEEPRVRSEKQMHRQNLTRGRILNLAASLNTYMINNNRYPPRSALAAGPVSVDCSPYYETGIQFPPHAWPVERDSIWLQKYIGAEEGAVFPFLDGWGRPILCETSEDGCTYTIVSHGLDGKPDAMFMEAWPQEEYERDFVFSVERGFISRWDGMSQGQ